MKNKSTICRFIVLLAAIAVSASLAGCGTPDPALADTDNTADTTSAPVETAEPELADLVPDLDYEGYISSFYPARHPRSTRIFR